MPSEQVLRLDATNTRVTFEVRWFGILPVRGRFGVVHGALGLNGDGLTSAQFTLEVDAASVQTGIALRDRHLRAERFLNANLYPVVRFTCDRARFSGDHVLVDGRLSLRGTERGVQCRCHLGGAPAPGTTVTARGTAVVPRRQFGVGVPPGLAAWNPMFRAIGDEVVVSVEVRVPAAILRAPALAPG